MEQKQFQAESKRLLDLMIHSIYTHREIFLRELISNASDAIDKRYFQAMQEGKALDRESLEIRLAADAEERTLTIIDNGCGMDARELEQNLGTIAKSGTKAFAEANELNGDVDIIGKFGVGFYAAFMVAERVEVYSHREGAEPYLWESTGEEGFTVMPCAYAPIGTKIVLHLKPDSDEANYSEFLEQYRLMALVKKYSDYIRYPIRMQMTRSRPKPDSEEYETVSEDTTLNSMVPLWRKNRSEISEEEYRQFYRDNFSDYEEPLTHLHIRAEGMLSYTALLFVPKHPPYAFLTREYKRGLKLYANGVMILEHAEELLPEYFGFVQGLVDSPDLSLNISRELLQHDRQLSAIANNLKKKIQAELLRILKEDRESYEAFYRSFGRTLKFGVYDNYGANRDFLKDLLLFHSDRSEKLITLQEYADGMTEAQNEIYFAAAETVQAAKSLPQTERVREHGYDILCLCDDVDEFALRILESYADHPFRSVSDPDLDLASEKEKAEMETQTENCRELLQKLQTALEGKVRSVRLTNRLSTSAACLVGDEGMTVEMYKVLRAMPNAGEIPMDFTLELNPNHGLFRKLSELDDDRLKTYAELLFAEATLLAGLPLSDPNAFAETLNELLI